MTHKFIKMENSNNTQNFTNYLKNKRFIIFEELNYISSITALTNTIHLKSSTIHHGVTIKNLSTS